MKYGSSKTTGVERDIGRGGRADARTPAPSAANRNRRRPSHEMDDAAAAHAAGAIAGATSAQIALRRRRGRLQGSDDCNGVRREPQECSPLLTPRRVATVGPRR